ncbi:MAG: transposase [Xenococcaceae cyanobacterium MO_188.B32]|nr:transposase [Xenococcaceae cyanobacterium MO_188.B32]
MYQIYSMEKMYGCQQQLIHTDSDIEAVLEFICSEANKLTNCAIYYCRQMFFKAHKYVSNYELDEIMKSNLHFKALRSAVAQQACHKVGESFKSYRQLAKLYREGKLDNKPKLPKYRKRNGLTAVSYPDRWLKLVNGQLKFALGKQVKAWFGIDSFTLLMPSNLDFKDIKEVRILPRNRCFYAEFVYKQKQLKLNLNQSNVLGLDPGLGNLLTAVSTTGKSFIIDGKKIKSINQCYNKKVAALKKGKPQDYWDEELAALSEKRNRQFKDIRNKVARFIINWCLTNNIGTIVHGWNQGIKNGSQMNKKVNQEFVTIPNAAIKDRVEQLAVQYGINFLTTEESYTSRSNFLNNDELPTFGEKSERKHRFTGKRGKKIKGKLNNLGRGGYLTDDGIWLNSDCLGAANIIRKQVMTQLKEISLAKVTRAVLSLPHRYEIFNDLSKSYRIRCEEARIYKGLSAEFSSAV